MKNIVWGLLTQPSIHNRITPSNKIETNSAIGRDLQSKVKNKFCEIRDWYNSGKNV